MNTSEFSAQFDVLLNSYNSRADKSDIRDIKLDEYEKSVLLTQAQNALVRDYYSGKNMYWQSFEDVEEVRQSLDQLVKTYITKETISAEELTEEEQSLVGDIVLTENSYFYKLPDDVWYVVYEAAKLGDDLGNSCLNGKSVLVTPTRHDDLWKQLKNPFRGPNKNRVLRLNIDNNKVELVSNYQLAEYILRYVAKPSPIILTALPEELSIEGVNTVTECKLNPLVHDLILSLAVRNAINSKAVGAIADSQK